MTCETLPLRMRMFAGPNGSGKTTVQREISRQFTSQFLGVLVKPDDLEATIGRNGRLDLGPFNIRVIDREVPALTLLSPDRLARPPCETRLRFSHW